MHKITLRVLCTLWGHRVSLSDKMWEPQAKFRPGLEVDTASQMRPVIRSIGSSGVKLSLMTTVNRQPTNTINLIGDDNFIGRLIVHMLTFRTIVHLGPLGGHTTINLDSANLGADVALGTNKRP